MSIARKVLANVENNMSKITSEVNKKKILNMIKETMNFDGKFCQTSYWKLKKKIFPQLEDAPMGKKMSMEMS